MTSDATTTSPGRRPPAGPPAFRSVLCGINGSRWSSEAALQAALIAGPAGELTLLAVTHERGVGASVQAVFNRRHAREVLERTRRALPDGAPAPTLRTVADEDTAGGLLAAAAEHDLLVVGGREHSRTLGILLGSIATAAVHRASVPVLVARTAPGPAPFPREILLATDGSPEADAATDVAARLATRHVAHVTIAACGTAPVVRRRVAEAVTTIETATGVEPVVLDEPGSVPEAITGAAGVVGASLIVIGSRGRTGLSAVGSVSERVAHRAPCSVLVVRPAA
jgi:nucleotide-binding universal stress UspA family protein